MSLHLTPVHVYVLRNSDGAERYLLINGGYCDGPAQADVEAEHPGWRVVDRTWRADWTQLAAPGNSEPGYTAGECSATANRYGPPRLEAVG